jgi:hypothetical protein
MKPIDPDTVRRLALIRVLLTRAENDSRLPVPYSFDSINRLHDVAEMFLALAVQNHHVQIPREFLEYWPTLEKALGRALTYRAQMQRFNKIRVNLKHYGIEPSQTEIESSRLAVRGLLYDECSNLFGVALGDVSLSNLVRSVKARQYLDNAESHWPESALEAFADLAEAFREVIDDYEARKIVTPHQSIFDSIDQHKLSYPSRGLSRDQAQFDKAIVHALKSLDYTVMIVGLGVDLRRYGKFRSLVPNVDYNIPGERFINDRFGVKRQQADFEFCRDFIITTAIYLAEFDYDFDMWQSYLDGVRDDLERNSQDVRSRLGGGS